MYTAFVTVTLRPSILDPQGKAIQHALASLGLDAVERVRVGRKIELGIEADSAAEAEEIAAEAARKLLANAVMEDFVVEVAPVAEAS